MAKGLFSFFGRGKKTEAQKTEQAEKEALNEEALKPAKTQNETAENSDTKAVSETVSKEDPQNEDSLKTEITAENTEPQENEAAALSEKDSPKPAAELPEVPKETPEAVSDITSDGLFAPISENRELKEPEEKPEAPEPAEAEKPAEEKPEQAGSDEALEAKEPEPAPEKPKKNGFFEKLKRTRENLSLGLSSLIHGKKIDEELYEDLETALLTADLGVETTQSVIEKLRDEAKLRELKDGAALRVRLKQILTDLLLPVEQPLEIKAFPDRPYVILMVGVNGAGKTTTIGKLTQKFKAQGKKVMLAAGDTFRAAAVEQLKVWGERNDVQVVSQPTGADSASVLYDALSKAKAHHADVLLCDTAGRLQNKDNLMEELRKIARVLKKQAEEAPDEVLLVLDATTGQNAVSQLQLFSKAVPVTGLIISKLDGTAKGGVVFALADRFRIPVRFIGVGEKAEDLRPFDAKAFVDALVGDE